jgi:hypothetical protein
MQKLIALWTANKVFILGLVGAVGMVLEQYMNEANPDYKVIGFAAAIAAISYLAKSLRGQWVSVLGVLGTSLSTVATAVESGNKVSWFQIIVSTILAIVSAVSPAGKSLSYETSPVVTEAKKEAAVIDSQSEPPKNPPVSK